MSETQYVVWMIAMLVVFIIGIAGALRDLERAHDDEYNILTGRKR